MNHRIKATPTGKKPVAITRDNPVAPAWPSYQGTSQFVGTSPSGRVTVYVDPSLGTQALQSAQDLVNDADRVVTANDGIFGTTGGNVSVIVFALGGAPMVPEAPTTTAATMSTAPPSKSTLLTATPLASQRCSKPN